MGGQERVILKAKTRGVRGGTLRSRATHAFKRLHGCVNVGCQFDPVAEASHC